MRRRAAGSIASLASLLALALPHAAAAADPTPVALAWSEPALVDSQPPFSHPTPLSGVSCPSASMCAIAAGNEILTSTDPLGGFHAWRHTKLGVGVSVSGISCPTTTDCVAVGYDAVVTLTGLGSSAPRRATVEIEPGVGNSLWVAACPSVSFCILGDAGGRIATSEDPLGWPASWRVEQIGPNVSSLWCLDMTLCGLTDRGSLAVATDPVNGGFGGVDAPGFVMGFACASHTFCVTIDAQDGAMTATDPVNGPWTTAGGVLGWTPVCGPPSLCLVIDDGRAWSATDPSGPWALTEIPAYGSSTSGACPSQEMCVITTSDGGISVSTNPTGGSDAWHAMQIAGTDALLSVACPIASLCVAFDDVGRVLTTHAPADGPASWSAPAQVDAEATVSDLSCPSASLCVGVERDGHILSSTGPGGGASTWKRVTLESAHTLAGIACPSTTLCVAAAADGRIVSSTDPAGGSAAWHVTSVDVTSLAGIACPSTTLCVAAAADGRIVASTDPAGGGDTWHVATIGPNALTGVACASVELCVTVDDAGGVVASTDPAGGAATWKRAQVAGVDRLSGLTCPSASLCVAIGGDAVAVSTQPAAGADAWHTTVVDDVATLQDVSCASPQLCVAVDDVGNALLGTSPSPPAPAVPAVDLPAVDMPPPPPPHGATAVTAVRLRALLRQALTHLGSGARIGALLGHGRYLLRLQAPISGAARIAWYSMPRGGRLAKRRSRPLLVASGSGTFTRPETRTIALRLTRAGRRLLHHASHVRLTARGTFTGSERVTASATITLRR